MAIIKVGEGFPIDPEDVGTCDSVHVFAYCVLDTGHAGQHVASDGINVVEVWDQRPTTVCP